MKTPAMILLVSRTRSLGLISCGVFSAAFFASSLTLSADSTTGPKNAVVLIVRHAEKPPTGPTLSPAGQQRAEAYARYFQNFTVDAKALTPEVIFAAKDSKESRRPRLTIEPFAKAAHLPIDLRFKSTQPAGLVTALRETDQGKRILICWRHGDIPDLLRALGVKPRSLLPDGKWPDPVFDWVLLLSYDQDGQLIPTATKRIHEHLMPGDSP